MDRRPDDRVVTFPQPLIRGTIVRRPNRFIIDVDLGGQVVPCHCPTTGRIGNLVLDGLPCLLSDSHSAARKTYHRAGPSRNLRLLTSSVVVGCFHHRPAEVPLRCVLSSCSFAARGPRHIDLNQRWPSPSGAFAHSFHVSGPCHDP